MSNAKAQMPKECQSPNDKTPGSKSGLEQPPMPGIASNHLAFFGHWSLGFDLTFGF
jgi:hypothetical protein